MQLEVYNWWDFISKRKLNLMGDIVEFLRRERKIPPNHDVYGGMRRKIGEWRVVQVGHIEGHIGGYGSEGLAGEPFVCCMWPRVQRECSRRRNGSARTTQKCSENRIHDKFGIYFHLGPNELQVQVPSTPEIAIGRPY